jgi:DNA-binding transcriptional MerR regulator
MPWQLRATGITYRQLDHWIRRGHLHPDNATAGSGIAREWSNDELAVAVRMARLVKAGLSPEHAARAAREGDEAWLSPNVKVVISA